MYTPLQAIEAIKARIDGVWDNPQLVKLGDLHTDRIDDISTIIDNTDSDATIKAHIANSNEIVSEFVDSLNGSFSNHISDPMLKQVLSWELNRVYRYVIEHNDTRELNDRALIEAAALQAATTVFKTFLEYGCKLYRNCDKAVVDFASKFR